jgi:hypothetical protein
MPQAVCDWLAAHRSELRSTAMDEIVEAALRKWPNVPHCYGWLALDARATGTCATTVSRPRARSRRSRAAASATTSCWASSTATTPADEQGAWFFQNGPQRVYVELEAAPWVWRVQPEPGWPVPHPYRAAGAAQAAWLDDRGRLFLHTELGLGLVHSWTWAKRPRPWKPVTGSRARCPLPRCRRALATSCGVRRTWPHPGWPGRPPPARFHGRKMRHRLVAPSRPCP